MASTMKRSFRQREQARPALAAQRHRRDRCPAWPVRETWKPAGAVARVVVERLADKGGDDAPE